MQARAKDLSHDMAGSDAEAGLRVLIDDEIERWADDAKRGVRRFELADPAQVAERAFRNLARYGPLTPLLDDPDVWEIMINAPDVILVKRHAGPSGYHDEVFHDDDHVARTLTKILDDASASHRKLDPSEGLQDAQLDDGSRLHIVHGDVSRGGHLMVNIRRFTGVAFRWPRRAGCPRHAQPGRGRFLTACCGPISPSCSPALRLGQDHPSVVLRSRARRFQAGGHRRGGVRGRRPPGQRGRHADPGGAA